MLSDDEDDVIVTFSFDGLILLIRSFNDEDFDNDARELDVHPATLTDWKFDRFLLDKAIKFVGLDEEDAVGELISVFDDPRLVPVDLAVGEEFVESFIKLCLEGADNDAFLSFELSETCSVGIIKGRLRLSTPNGEHSAGELGVLVDAIFC